LLTPTVYNFFSSHMERTCMIASFLWRGKVCTHQTNLVPPPLYHTRKRSGHVYLCLWHICDYAAFYDFDIFNTILIFDFVIVPTVCYIIFYFILKISIFFQL
jgi:hypothetical protein